MSKTNREFNLNSILAEIGSFGKFQLFNLLCLVVPLSLTSIYTLSYIFTAGNLNYRCSIPICDSVNGTNEYSPKWLEYAVPYQGERPVQCEKFATANNSVALGSTELVCEAVHFERNITEKCNEFVYESDEKTIVNEWNLTCHENHWKLSLVGTINVIGTFLCLPLTGIVSDLYGRRFAFVLGMLACGIFGVLRSFSWSYISFLTFEFLDPLFGSGSFTSGYVLALELVGPKHRLIGATMISFFYSFGSVLLGVLAMYTQNWRIILRIAYIPAFFFVSYIWLVPESVRWLHTKGQTDQVIAVLRRAAKVNKVVLQDSTLKELQNLKADANDQDVEEKGSGEGYGIMDIFKYPSMVIRVISCALCWFTTTFVYYGLSLTSVTLSGDKFTNFMFASVSELPGYILFFYLNNTIGRKKTLSGSLIGSGICCIGSVFITSNKTASMILFLIGKCSITISFSTLYIYSTELFPTTLRHSLLALSSGVGRIGNMLAPQMTLVGIYVKYLPMFLFGGFAFVSGLLALNFPETLNKPLPDTLEEADQMKRKKGKPNDENETNF